MRNDEVVVVGDGDSPSPENARRAGNDALIGNLADSLVTNDRTPSSEAGSTGPTRPPGLGQPPANGTAS
ncbi:hypothetical protein [Halorientalis regularis]|uniref:hypothetical protein n=1 Tax=Halorientalis regularis TaxID=660518 RepID=UPI001C31DDEE|nr:hypothetical protein [Halorientalis regularis]